MTPVGHSLTGLTLGVIFLPRQTSIQWKIMYFACFIGFANIPDIPLRGWGHNQYQLSHSLFVNGFIIVALFVILSLLPRFRKMMGNYRVMIGAMCAWFSHLLLDTFYNNGLGLAMFWPFSQAHMALPIPWFSVMPNSSNPFTLQFLRIYVIEGIAYFSVFIIAFTMRIIQIYRQNKMFIKKLERKPTDRLFLPSVGS